MMKRVSSLVLLATLALLLTAMGGKGSGFERTPRVEKNFAVLVTDTSGNKIEGDKFSWEGRVHLDGSLGMAQVVIPFDKIKELTVGEKRDRKVRVAVRLKDGSETMIDVDADARCYGDAGFGSFMLTMAEIKSVTFK
jgi:hypothetical protein